MAVLGFFLVFFLSSITKDSRGTTFGTVVHADFPDGVTYVSCDGTGCAGCCGSCGDGCAADCGGSGGCAGDCGSGS